MHVGIELDPLLKNCFTHHDNGTWQLVLLLILIIIIIIIIIIMIMIMIIIIIIIIIIIQTFINESAY